MPTARYALVPRVFHRLSNFSGFKGVVKAVEATMTENISRDENGRIQLIEYPFKQDWEVYQVDTGSILVDCHISELEVLQQNI